MTGPMIRFQQNNRRLGSRTDTWEVWNGQLGLHVGGVRWHAPWRKYCFFPDADRLFDEECLKTLAAFVEWETRKHKKGKRAFPPEATA